MTINESPSEQTTTTVENTHVNTITRAQKVKCEAEAQQIVVRESEGAVPTPMSITSSKDASHEVAGLKNGVNLLVSGNECSQAPRTQDVVELLGGDQVEEIVSGPEGEECELVLCRRDESLVEDAAEGGEDVDVELRTVGDGVGVDLGVPVASDGSDLELLRKQVEEDESLKHCRRLASSESQGYYWKNGLIFHRKCDEILGTTERLVVPKPRRDYVLSLAHDQAGHFGSRKVGKIVNERFTWPGLCPDIDTYVKSCEMCLKYNKSGNKQVQLVERPIVSEPFESMAMDIVGPLPKGKGGALYLLTTICMATRWPDAEPLRTLSSTEVAEALVKIFSRSGLPSKLLSDRGKSFLSRICKKLCEYLGIDLVHTAPYRPQSNGIVERFHGTLKPMLAKADDRGVDWVTFLPMALAAVRKVPNRDTGFSPYELVCGRKMRGLLDIVFAGWAEEAFTEVDTNKWVESLRSRLLTLRECAHSNAELSAGRRVAAFNKNKSLRELKEGQKVLLKIPGLRDSLEASWEGPYLVKEKLSRVNYRVCEMDGKKARVVHINNCKVYHPRQANVNSVCVVAEEDVVMEKKKCVLTEERCEGFDQSILDSLLERFSDVFDDSPGKCNVGLCRIDIIPGSPVVNLPPHRVPMHLREALDLEVRSLVDKGIVVANDAEWSSPVVPVRKPNGSLRLCIDFHALNEITPLRRYYLPTLSDILDRAGSSRVLSKLDLTAGFHQIAMDEPSSELTTFVCPSGKYKFVRMPFGLKNAPAIFQEIIERVLKPVQNNSSNYIDDVLVYSDSWADHLLHLTSVFECLRGAGLTAKRAKCEFGRSYMLFLGHKIGCGSLSIPIHRVSAIREYPKPCTKKQMRAFLGSMGYYRQFVPNFGKWSSVLTPATALNAPKVVSWTEDMEAAFENLKVSLCASVVLNVPCTSDEFLLYTDASGWGLGACLHVLRDGKELPVAFYSRQLQGAEHHYGITELETLAIVAAIHHFMFYLYGAPVTVVTDHQACTALLTSKVLNRRLQRFALRLKGMDISIIFRPGRLNGNADGLSRIGSGDDAVSQESVIGPWSDSLASMDASSGGGTVGPLTSSSSSNYIT